jgi:hypothetical protein
MSHNFLFLSLSRAAAFALLFFCFHDKTRKVFFVYVTHIYEKTARRALARMHYTIVQIDAVVRDVDEKWRESKKYLDE